MNLRLVDEMQEDPTVDQLKAIIGTLESWLEARHFMNEVEPRRLSKALDALAEVYAMRLRRKASELIGSLDIPFDLDQSQDGSWLVIAGKYGEPYVARSGSVLEAGNIMLDLVAEHK